MGVLTGDAGAGKSFGVMFPSSPEVTGVSYSISCIGSSRRTTRSSLTSQLKLILIIP